MLIRLYRAKFDLPQTKNSKVTFQSNKPSQPDVPLIIPHPPPKKLCKLHKNPSPPPYAPKHQLHTHVSVMATPSTPAMAQPSINLRWQRRPHQQ